MNVGIAQAAAVAGVHVESFRRLQARGQMPFAKIGWRWRLKPAHLFLLTLMDDVRNALGLDLKAAAEFCRAAIPLLRADWQAVAAGDRWLASDDHHRPVLVSAHMAQETIFGAARSGAYARPVPLGPTIARTKSRAAFARVQLPPLEDAAGWWNGVS